MRALFSRVSYIYLLLIAHTHTRTPTHTHPDTVSVRAEFIKCAVVSRFRVLPNGRHISETCHLAPHKDDKSS